MRVGATSRSPMPAAAGVAVSNGAAAKAAATADLVQIFILAIPHFAPDWSDRLTLAP
jgi:hypothetical protein